MVYDSSPFNLELLRNWNRSQIKILKEFAIQRFLSQPDISTASGMQEGSHGLGGKLTPLTRAGLIKKAGKDDYGKMQWQLNEDKVNRQQLLEFIERLGV